MAGMKEERRGRRGEKEGRGGWERRGGEGWEREIKKGGGGIC